VPVEALAEQLGFAPVGLGRLAEQGSLVQARGRVRTQLIFLSGFRQVHITAVCEHTRLASETAFSGERLYAATRKLLQAALRARLAPMIARLVTLISANSDMSVLQFKGRFLPGKLKHYDRATNAHFRPDKPRGATGKSLIVLSPWLTLNQRVPGSSPGAPTIAKSSTYDA
jgi:hypothetical protein